MKAKRCCAEVRNRPLPTCYTYGVLAGIRISLAFAILLVAAGGRVCAQTQFELTDQACSKFKKADSELNVIYQQILAAKAKDVAFVKAFREAQKAWMTFRDAHVRSLYPNSDPAEYGSVNPMCRCGVLERFTAQRRNELRSLWIEGTVEGDSCAGSLPIKLTRPAPKR